MKKQFFFLLVGLITYSIGAQGINEMINYSTSDLNGTARFKSMSGAFGALGGDLSAITINPAGSAIFNHSEVGITLSTSSLENTTSFFDNSKLTDQNQFAFDQAGTVFVMKNFGDGNWKKISFGINFQTQRNFKNNVHAGFVNNQNSIEDYFLDYAQGINFLDLGADNITIAYIDIGNTPGLGYNAQQAFLGFQSYLIDFGDLSEDGVDNPSYYSYLSHNGSVNQELFLDTDGMSDQLNFNIAAQFKDSFYIGMNLNFHSIDYREKSDFYEYGYANDSAVREVRFYNELYTLGKGFSLQLGAIGKINNNIRLGLSYQSPTWYSLEDEISQFIVTYSGEENVPDYFIDPNVIVVFDNTTKLQTPSSLTASGAFIFGKKGLLSVDYINKNYRNTSLAPNNQFSIANAVANQILTNTNAIRIGGEYRINRLSLRGGYRFEENPYKESGLGDDTKGFSMGMGYDFGGTLLSMSYNKTSSGIGRQLYTTGLTDQFNILQDQSNVSVSLVFKL